MAVTAFIFLLTEKSSSCSFTLEQAGHFVTPHHMKDHSRPKRKMQTASGAAILLRLERGAIGEIARNVGVHPSFVSRLARGPKTSEPVRMAITRHLLGQREGAPASALVIEHGARR